jgi:hypothetical protein
LRHGLIPSPILVVSLSVSTQIEDGNKFK